MNSTSINIVNSFEKSERRFNIPGAGDRCISIGDRMFARLVLKGQTIMEFVVTSVRDLSELFCLVHRKSRGLRGLAKLYLRNMSRGWSEERPLMLYSEPDIDVISSKRKYNVQPRTNITVKNIHTSPYFTREVKQLSFPWEL